MLANLRDFLGREHIFGRMLTRNRRPIELAAVTLASLVIFGLIQVLAIT
jgi:hypothetical protein